jgi:DNA-binding MarR family transcriptional regulator
MVSSKMNMSAPMKSVKSRDTRRMSNKHKPLSISDQVLISMRQIIRSIDLHSKRLVKQFGLTGPQLVILQEVSRNDLTTASELARASSLSQATVTGILDRLENRGLVCRQRSQNDRRRIHVTITSSGEGLLDSAPPLMQESFTKRFESLQEWEQHMILSSLKRIVSLTNARQIDAAPILATGPIENPPGAPNDLPVGVTNETN